MRWWSNGESNSGRRSCKDQLQPAACPEMVPSARFELASCALQARAITRFANWAKLVRTSVIETDSPEWHSGARPSSYDRNDAWWVTLESNQAGTKARALQARSVPRLGVTRIGGERAAYVPRDRSWRRAEDLSLTPFGAIGVRSRAGAPVRLTLQGGGQRRP